MFRYIKICITVLLSTNPPGHTDLNNAESNLITAIRRLLPKFPNLHLEQVERHQEDHIPVCKLAFKAELNIEYDPEMIKEQMNACGQEVDPNQRH